MIKIKQNTAPEEEQSQVLGRIKKIKDNLTIINFSLFEGFIDYMNSGKYNGDLTYSTENGTNGYSGLLSKMFEQYLVDQGLDGSIAGK